MLPDHDGAEDEGNTADGGFPMPTLSTMQTGLRPQQQQAALGVRSGVGGGDAATAVAAAAAGVGGAPATTLMLRSLLTGANVPVVANTGVGVIQGVVSQTSPVTLEPVTAVDPNAPGGGERAGK